VFVVGRLTLGFFHAESKDDAMRAMRRSRGAQESLFGVENEDLCLSSLFQHFVGCCWVFLTATGNQSTSSGCTLTEPSSDCIHTLNGRSFGDVAVLCAQHPNAWDQ